MKGKIEISTIRRLKQENKPDELIRKDLGLSPSKYLKYKEKLQEQERKELESLVLEDVAYELLEYVDSLRDTIRTCRTLSKSGTSLEKLEADRMILFCHSELIKIMSNGPQILANIQVAPAIKKAFQSIEKRGQDIVDVSVEEVKPEPESKKEIKIDDDKEDGRKKTKN